MLISSSPFPCFSSFLRKTRNIDFINNFYFFPLGRSALLSGLVSLGLKKQDSIIIPAYICDSAIHPLREYGFKLIFMDVDKEMNLSIDQVQEVIIKNNIKALLTVHYFGFTKDFDKLIRACHELGVKVVEDCTHSFLSQLSRNKVSIRSDMEIFSMRKTLPIQDGGALRVSSIHKNIKINSDQCISTLSAGKYLLKRLIWKITINFGFNIYRPFLTRLKDNFRRISKDSRCGVNIETCQPSQQLKYYLKSDRYMNRARTRIRANFSRLSIEVKKIGFELAIDSLSVGAFPQALAIYNSNDGLMDYLRINGVGAWCWPGNELPLEVSSNPKIYLNSVYFNKKIILLPIHQDISHKQCDYMIKVLLKWQDRMVKERGDA